MYLRIKIVMNNASPTTMKLEVVSREMIKPSSPTPKDLNYYKISLLDQVAPPSYIEVVFFYHPPTNTSRSSSHHLKGSLSEALAHFYPLAGRMRENTYVDCNDEGATYLETRVVNSSLAADFLDQKPDPDKIRQLVFRDESSSSSLLFVQATFFPCGGIALGVSMSHKIADAATFFAFMTDWSEVSLGRLCQNKTVAPDFSACASRFPPREDFPEVNPHALDPPNSAKFVTKRFVFPGSRVLALKDRARGKNVQQPTRVEAVSALLLKSAMSVASKQSLSASSASRNVISMPVNMRARLVPPMPKHAFGNACGLMMVEIGQHEIQVDNLICQWRKGLEEVVGSFISRSSLPWVDPKLLYIINSWCRFPAYETDLGWGKPAWVTHVSAFCPLNMITMMDASDGEGVEALVHLNEGDMALFETDPELLDFASPNPCPSTQLK